MRLIATGLLALAITLPAVESTTVTDTTSTSYREGQAPVTATTHDEVERTTERTGGKGRKTEWTRDATTERSNGSSAELHAEGNAASDGDSGTREVHRRGRVTDAEGRTRTWKQEVDAQWRANDEGGRDSERTAVTTDGQGRTRTAETDRHSEAKGGKSAFREETDVTTWRGDTFKTWSTGHQERTETKTGFVISRELKGNNRENEKWIRNETETVTRNADGSRSIHIVAIIKRPGQRTQHEVTRGAWTPLESGRGWEYEATVTLTDGPRTVDYRRIEQTHRRNPVDAEGYGGVAAR
jgi:hypothetical protein